MFTTELANTYSKKPFLNELIPYDEFLPQLTQFILQEVRLGARHLNPYRFSYLFGHEPKDVIPLFIAISNDKGLLRRLYKYDCSNCETTNLLTDDQIKNFQCYECSYEGNLTTSNFLEEVKVIFEISDSLMEEVMSRLKDRASSVTKTKQSEEANRTKGNNVSLNDFFNYNKLSENNADDDLLIIQDALLTKMSHSLSTT
jgi:hypothetical protein